MMRLSSVRCSSTTPSSSARMALPFGTRASNSSSTRGRPDVMSIPATPPVWKVRMVSCVPGSPIDWAATMPTASPTCTMRSEEHTSELQSQFHLVCRLLLEKKKKQKRKHNDIKKKKKKKKN